MLKDRNIKLKKTDVKAFVIRIFTSYKGAWLLIFAGWMIPFLAAWPGIYVIDNVFQMKWFLEGKISAHHPVIHTYLLGWSLKFGRNVFRSYEAGLGIFCLLQMLFLSAVFSYTMKKLEAYVSVRFRILCILFFALIPYNPVSAFTATKDTVFAGCFLLVVLKTFLLVCRPEEFFSSKKDMISYGLLVFVMCAFRNTGIYIFVFSLPALLIVCRKHWKQALVIGFCCLLAWGLYTGPVYGAFHIEKGSSAEILSVPMQQLARVMVCAPEELTEKERESIEMYMPDYMRYAPRVADPVKDTFRGELFDEDPVKFIKLWLQVGIKCPIVYVDAFRQENIGFWNPFARYPDPDTYLPYIPYHGADLEQVGVSWKGQVFIERDSVFPKIAVLYEKLTETGGYNRIPGVSFIYSIAVAFWLIFAGIVYCVIRKRYRMAAPFCLLIGLWGTLMLSPVVVFRYGYPLLISLPVVYAMCKSNLDSE